MEYSILNEIAAIHMSCKGLKMKNLDGILLLLSKEHVKAAFISFLE